MNFKIVNYLCCVAMIPALVAGCKGTVDSDTYIVLPQAEALKNLPPETQATFRVEAEIPGLLSKSPCGHMCTGRRGSGWGWKTAKLRSGHCGYSWSQQRGSFRCGSIRDIGKSASHLAAHGSEANFSSLATE